MFPQKIIAWCLPASLRHHKTHPRYYEMHNVATACLLGLVSMSTIPLVLLYFKLGSHLWLYYLSAATIGATLLSMRYLGHWRTPNLICAAIAYVIIYTWVSDSGLIYSTNTTFLYIYLIAALLTDKKLGWYVIFTNWLFLGFIYYRTLGLPFNPQVRTTLGSPFYALLMHATITVFMGGFLAYGLNQQEKARRQIKALQDQQISLLDEAVRQRTEQLNTMRQTMATDFHDHTGNMLAAINRQAALLELKLRNQPDILPFVESITANSNELYASSKDFLWNLNHDSDNPLTLFRYLTGYGQTFYNQFDISFSAEVEEGPAATGQLDPFAALNLIYIFKEAMSNSIKHSGATEVVMQLKYVVGQVCYTLTDNGTWKEAGPGTTHYGLENMQRRCRQSGFEFALAHKVAGTQISVSLPVHTPLTQSPSL